MSVKLTFQCSQNLFESADFWDPGVDLVICYLPSGKALTIDGSVVQPPPFRPHLAVEEEPLGNVALDLLHSESPQIGLAKLHLQCPLHKW